MTPLTRQLSERLARAIAPLAGEPADAVDPVLRPTGDPRFGDYQCNAAMALARRLGRKPRDVAQEIVAAARLDDLAEPPEVAGPGFINIRLRDAALGTALAALPAAPATGEDRVGIAPQPEPQRVVLDYSSPNIAKQMHVGHLRSTVIGDAFARLLGFLGHDVVRINHVGDWGTQFGMLIRWYADHPLPSPATHDDVLAAIEGDYRAAQERFQQDEAFAAEARAAVGRLQRGDADARRVWADICRLSGDQFHETYRRLDVLLRAADVRGESFYNDRLAAVLADLPAALRQGGGAAGDVRVELRSDQGAECLYFTGPDGAPLFKGKDGEPLPMIVRKSDGAFLYATTDLASMRFRVDELGGQRLIYVTDARQKQHFEMLFAAARATGWAPPEVRLEHVTFGSVLGEDRRPLKTRSGQNVRLAALLDEAEQRALAVLRARAADAAATGAAADGLPDPAQAADAVHQPIDAGAAGGSPEPQASAAERELAGRIGMAAIKYADLSRDRNTDYVFSWEQMLALDGNTAPYLLYAYARIRSIYRKAAESAALDAAGLYARREPLPLAEPAERTLALRLVRLADAIEVVARDLTPHVLCAYLYDLARDFMRFYESCPVLEAPAPDARHARLRLCDITARTLKLGLGLLGIDVVERM